MAAIFQDSILLQFFYHSYIYKDRFCMSLTIVQTSDFQLSFNHIQNARNTQFNKKERFSSAENNDLVIS